MKKSLVVLKRGSAGLAWIFLATALSSCALNQRWLDRQAALAKAKADAENPPLFDWRGDDISGPATVNIQLSEQKAYIYRGGEDAGWTYLASGTASHRTPAGIYKVLEKKEKKSSNTYGIIVNASGNVVDWDAKAGREAIPKGGRFVGAPMPYWMRLTNTGIGMHAGPIPRPGLPASHGCIRLPQEMAAKLFDVVEVGTKVTITGEAPRPQTQPPLPGSSRVAQASSVSTQAEGAQ